MTGVNDEGGEADDPNPGGVHMLTLVGADHHITCTETSRPSRHRRSTWHRYTCTCKRSGNWYAWHPDAVVQAEVHARLWHGAEPDRGKWRNPNVT